jgi:hypothetical protein
MRHTGSENIIAEIEDILNRSGMQTNFAVVWV